MDFPELTILVFLQAPQGVKDQRVECCKESGWGSTVVNKNNFPEDCIGYLTFFSPSLKKTRRSCVWFYSVGSRVVAYRISRVTHICPVAMMSCGTLGDW